MGNGRALIIVLGGLAVAFSLSLGAAEPLTDRDPVEVLRQVTAKVTAAALHVRNYTCVETVERHYYKPAANTLDRACAVVLEQRRNPTLDMALKWFLTDRLRLDVTMARTGEIYSWVGASRLDARIDQIVRDGPIGSGAFAAFLDVIFLMDAKKFTFLGHRAVDGSDRMEYTFQVAKADSHYSVRVNDSFVEVAYSGIVLVDPATSDVVRLWVRSAELPIASGNCETATTLDYGTVQIGSAPLLLPTHVQQRFVGPDGSETENFTSFASCREYRGDSTIVYGSPAESLVSAGSAGGAVPAPPLPPGLSFALELLTPIDTDRMAAGDQFRARLVRPIRNEKSKALARAGSIVEGRLLRLQTYHLPPPEVLVVFAPRTLWINGEKVPLAANRDWSSAWKETRRKNKKPPRILMPAPTEGAAGVFQFPGEHVVVPKGFRSDWRTAKTEAPGK